MESFANSEKIESLVEKSTENSVDSVDSSGVAIDYSNEPKKECLNNASNEVNTVTSGKVHRRKDSSDSDSDQLSAKKLKTEGSMGNLVAGHYNNLREEGLSKRNESRILYMRNLNNWLKSYLIKKHIDDVRESFPDEQRIVAIDLGCGKGGDLLKWTKAKISHLVCVDIAEISISQCKDRYDENKRRRFNPPPYTAEFIVADCTKVCFQSLMQDPSRKVHFVSCQFAFHYCFESLSQAETMIKNASNNLKTGGYFLLTVPDANDINKRLSESESNRFGNEVFRIEFPEDRPSPPPLFGDQYRFFLEGVVDCPEFLVHQPTLKRICKKYGLECVYEQRFGEVFQSAFNDHSCKFLLHKMSALESFPQAKQSSPNISEYSCATKFLEQTGKPSVLTLTQSEWEAVNLYTAFGFKKVAVE